MKHISSLSICIILLTSVSLAQPKEQKKIIGYSNDIAVNLNLPLGYFSNTHSFSIGVQYSWSDQRYGKMSAKPHRPVGFTANAGMDHYFGKKETIGTPPNTTSYKYDGITYAHLYGGIIYNPCTKGNISLTAGPYLGFANGNTDVGYGVNLSGSIYMCRSGRFAVTPNFTLMKQHESDGLYSFGLRGSYAF